METDLKHSQKPMSIPNKTNQLFRLVMLTELLRLLREKPDERHNHTKKCFPVQRVRYPRGMDKDKEFWEEWDMRLKDIFKTTEKRRSLESKERKEYVEFIYRYTETHGVRETVRRLDDIGYSIGKTTLSEMRHGSEKYDADALHEVVKAIQSLNEKK